MVNLFDKISDKNQEKLLKLLEANTFTFNKDTSILKTSKGENIIGIVLSGYIQIIRNDYNGNTTILEDLEENAIFGSMFSEISSDECEIITKATSKIIIIDYNHVIESTNNNYVFYNQFIQNLLLLLSEKINERNERIEYFKITSNKKGTKNIYLPFTFKELAEYLAVDRSAMTRELKNLKEEGFIDIKSKKITLLY